MMNRTRPEITENRVEQIRGVIRENPEWNRTQISQHICRMWGWQGPRGEFKDISCRDLLRELDRAGRIRLPAPLKPSRSGGGAGVIKHMEHDTTPIIEPLSKLRPLRIENVSAGRDLTACKSYIDQYHYLGFDRTIGENMKYMVYSRDGQPLSCLLFGSAAWSCRQRDEFIGWDKRQRAHGLSNITNNTRFLIFPWVRVVHLASHILSLVAHRVADDWQYKYGHPVYCLETFLEAGRFRGSSYRAANWIYVGRTTGRGRDGGHKHAILPIKDIYLYPLAKNFQAALTDFSGA
ncbi:MAG: DUF4338 domain-containing protein [Candidatus Desulfaltia sp.]|nr:DUF4338 domain-containing protein [Candidatus Desulfaltia sp.]